MYGYAIVESNGWRAPVPSANFFSTAAHAMLGPYFVWREKYMHIPQTALALDGFLLVVYRVGFELGDLCVIRRLCQFVFKLVDGRD